MEAGFGPASNIRLLAEPEAAAIYAIKADLDAYTPKKGDNILVCDAGGGTVDLITYHVKGTQPLDLREVVPGRGGFCGSMCLNWRFEAYLADKLGKHYTDTSTPPHERAKQAVCCTPHLELIQARH